MNRKVIVMLLCLFLIITPGSSVANPGGNGDADRDYSCGGSCHGDPSLSMASDATIDITLGNEAFSGQAVAIHVTVSDITTSSNGIIGLFILSSLNGNSDSPEDHGWNLIQDPNGGSSNYIEMKAPSSGSITVTWVLLSPENSGSHELYIQIHHGSNYGKAYAGVSDKFDVNVQDVPEGLPGLAIDWVAPSFRVSGDNSPLSISTRNSTDIAVHWMLEGEWEPNLAIVECKSNSEEVCNEWEASIPATMGETNILYRVTTYNGTYSVEQPWLKMGTAPPPFEGEVWSARAHSFAFALLIISFLVTLQARLYPVNSRIEFDQTKNVIDSSLVPSDDSPGWLWNSETEEWVEDPEYSGGNE